MHSERHAPGKAGMLSVDIQQLADVTVMRCKGRLYAEDSGALREAVLGRLLGREAVLDLAGITAIDAGGLGLLLSLQKSADVWGTRLRVTNLPPRVEQVIALTRLRDVLGICSALPHETPNR